MRILVIAPHPDDEVLGCAGTIKKHTKAGDTVSLCIVTKPYTPDWTQEYIENKQKEIKNSCAVLGIKEVHFLDFPTVKLDTVGQKNLNDAIADCVKRVNPQILFIPFWQDINNDHRLVSEAGLVAARPRPGISIKKVLAYEALSETEWGINQAEKLEDVFLPNYYEDIGQFIESKKEAMSCYASELKEYPHPRSLEGIEILAKKRGMEAGLLYAEAFKLVRQIH
ncbi:MAG: PIG-L deacetylase family protein [bacterium]|nr:PIG-L deacetylase family protein [bacterium]